MSSSRVAHGLCCASPSRGPARAALSCTPDAAPHQRQPWGHRPQPLLTQHTPRRRRTMKLGGFKKLPPKKAAATCTVVGFGDASDDEEDAGGPQTLKGMQEKGRAMMARAIQSQTEKNKRLEDAAMKRAEEECPGIFNFEERWDAADKKKAEAEEARKNSSGLRSAKWVADMKKNALERQTEREMTDLRLIQREAETTDHLYKEVDAEIAPIITPSYRVKLTEQSQRAKEAAEREANEQAVEKVGFKSFRMAMMKAQAGDGGEGPTEEEEYAKELEIYLHEKEQKKKKERRARYLAMKRQQQQQPSGPVEDDREETEVEAEPEPEPEATPTDAPAAPTHEPAPLAEEEPSGAPAVVESDTPMEENDAKEDGGAEGGTDADGSSMKRVIDQLAFIDADRKRLVHEQRVARRRKRNDDDDVDRARDRFLRRKLERMKLRGAA